LEKPLFVLDCAKVCLGLVQRSKKRKSNRAEKGFGGGIRTGLHSIVFKEERGTTAKRVAAHQLRGRKRGEHKRSVKKKEAKKVALLRRNEEKIAREGQPLPYR